jgi:hypothetical protein
VNIFNADNLEKLLVANWTHFLDSSKLMAYVLKTVQENANRLDIISSEKIKNKGIKITISRFVLKKEYFLVWVDFNVPLQQFKNADGTLELLVFFNGDIQVANMFGNIT